MFVSFFVLFRFGALVSARVKSYKNITSISFARKAVGDFSFLARLPSRIAPSPRKASARARHRDPLPLRKASRPRITPPGSPPPRDYHRITTQDTHLRSRHSSRTWHSQICRAHLEEGLVFLSDNLRLQRNIIYCRKQKRSSSHGILVTICIFVTHGF